MILQAVQSFGLWVNCYCKAGITTRLASEHLRPFTSSGATQHSAQSESSALTRRTMPAHPLPMHYTHRQNCNCSHRKTSEI